MSEVSTSAERTISKSKEQIIIEAKRLYENCIKTSKSHFNEAQFWQALHFVLGIPTIILAGIAGTLIFINHQLTAGILSIFIVILSSLTTFLDPKEKSNTHLNAGNNYDSLLTRIRIFWSIDCWQEDSEIILTEKLRSFSEERDRLNRDYPQPMKWAYKMAKKGISDGEADYSIDKDI